MMPRWRLLKSTIILLFVLIICTKTISWICLYFLLDYDVEIGDLRFIYNYLQFDIQ